MKKLRPLFFALTCITVISCQPNDDNTSIAYRNTDRYYSMDARFSKSRTREVEEYMDRKIGRRSKISFVKTQLDGDIALDDQSKFYIRKSPGILRIKLDKHKNSEEAYYAIKSMCEGIKLVVTNH